jgi:hypothetical protein
MSQLKTWWEKLQTWIYRQDQFSHTGLKTTAKTSQPGGHGGKATSDGEAKRNEREVRARTKGSILNEYTPTPSVEKSTESFDLVSSDNYNSLFSTPLSTPEVVVDSQVWNKIKASLPQDYVIPNPVTINIFKSMNGNVYNSTPLSTQKWHWKAGNIRGGYWKRSN